MSRDPEATRRECARMLELGEEYVSRICYLRDTAPTPREQEELDERLKGCEELLAHMCEAYDEVAYQSFRASAGKRDIEEDRLYAALPRSYPLGH